MLLHQLSLAFTWNPNKSLIMEPTFDCVVLLLRIYARYLTNPSQQNSEDAGSF